MKKFTILAICLMATGLAFGQWVEDPAINTLVADDNPEVTRTLGGSNGYTYSVFWNSLSDTTNYDLRLQILDPSGVKQFDPAGEIISASIPMSTYTVAGSMRLDADNNVYVGATGTNGADGFVFKLDSEGNNIWGTEGINLGYAYLVRTLPLSSGDVIVSWYDGDGIAQLQKFDSNGVPIWDTPVGLPNFVPAQSFEMSDGGFVTLYHERVSFGVTSVMYAQRYNSDGEAQWDEPVQLFDSSYNTAYNREYSAFQDGDVVYCSYQLAHSSRFDAYVQRINPDGTLPWGLQGADFDVAQTMYEMGIEIAGSSDSDFIWGVCRYTDTSQGQQGVYVQKFDKNTGDRLLSENGKEVYPVEMNGVSPAGSLELYEDQPIFLTMDGNTLNANLLDANGDFVWPENTMPMATHDSQKTRIQFAKLSDNGFVTTFREDKGNGFKIYAQYLNYNPTGVAEIVSNENIRFQNPVNSSLELQSPDMIQSVVIYTIPGQVIYRTDDKRANNLVIDVNAWNPGIYFGVVETTDGTRQSIKVLKL